MRSAWGSLAVVVSVAAAACAGHPVTPRPPQPDPLRVQVGDRGAGAVRAVPLEEYVAAAALSEFTPAAGNPAAVEAMFEVQAILARTYAVSHRGRHAAEGFDLCSTTHCQLYDPARLPVSRLAPLVREAVSRTSGLVLAFDGAVADAVYHADCGGRTTAASDVWSGSTPYLLGRIDDCAARAAHTGWQFAVDRTAMARALDADPRTRVRGLHSIVIISRDASGRAQRILLHGERDTAVRGTELREVLTAAFGPRSIRSTLFDIVPGGDQFVFSGRGFGHGVGLCQAGAFARIVAGGEPRAVLERYYPGTTLVPAARFRPSSRRPRG